MSDIALTVAPIFLLILAGYGFCRFGFLKPSFWQPAENLAYYILLPALIIGKLSKADLTVLPVSNIAITIVVLILISTCFITILRPLFKMSGPAFTSVLQGSTRINAYIAFAVADLIYGPDGIILCALFVAIAMPVCNIICISALAFYAHSDGPKWANVPKEIARNPIILACIIGWVINIVSLPLPNVAIEFLNILDRAALPLALLCVGAGLVAGFSYSMYKTLFITCILKLIFMPVSAALIMSFTGLTGLTFVIVMLFATCPASPASYVLARQLGGDAPLMAAILTIQTLLSAIAIPIVLNWATEITVVIK